MIQFSNLYARLLTQHVFTHKWAGLHFLYQLAESNASGEESSRSEIIEYDQSPRANDGSQPRRRGRNPTALSDAFSLAGLPQLPSHRSRSREDLQSSDHQTQGPGQAKSGMPEQNSCEPLSEKDSSLKLIPTEPSLLRDLPFTLQGLSSTHLPFTSTTTLTLPTSLPLPLISLLHTLAEPSLLYRSLSEFAQSRGVGLIGQSLRSAIGNELRSYLGLIATLEGEIRRAIVSLDIEKLHANSGKVGVTLKRCVVWTREATMGLRLMSFMEEEAKSKSKSFSL